MEKLVILIGPPAAGKSSFARKMKEQGYHVHSSDEIRKELFGCLTCEHNDVVFETLHNRIKEDLSNGIPCVYDATNVSRKMRMSILEELSPYADPIIGVVFVAPLNVLIERDAKRGEASVGKDAIWKRIRGFQPPYYYEGFNDIRIYNNVSASEVPEEMRAKIVDKYDPVDMVDIAHDNPHHSATIGHHMLEAEKVARKHLFPHAVCVAARYHDIGKACTKSFTDYHGEPSEVAHFFSHENVSAYQYLVRETLLKQKKDLQWRENALYVSNLISWHMRPATGWIQSGKAKLRDRKLVGEGMFADILMLNMCDQLAH